MSEPAPLTDEELAGIESRLQPPPDPGPPDEACFTGDCGGCARCEGPSIPVFGATQVARLIAALRASRAEVEPVTAATPNWPAWLTPEHSAIHTAVENEIKRALQHCFDSADAADMPWTTEGWISCSASNILAMLKHLGCPPPPVGEVEALPMPRDDYGEADEPCSTAGHEDEAATALVELVEPHPDCCIGHWYCSECADELEGGGDRVLLRRPAQR